jgi:hypothetical protein
VNSAASGKDWAIWNLKIVLFGKYVSWKILILFVDKLYIMTVQKTLLLSFQKNSTFQDNYYNRVIQKAFSIKINHGIFFNNYNILQLIFFHSKTTIQVWKYQTDFKNSSGLDV